MKFGVGAGELLRDAQRERPGGRRIGGLIDAERAFWGDPLAEFVSLALFGDIDLPDRLGCLSLLDRGKRPQSFSPRLVALCRQADDYIA